MRSNAAPLRLAGAVALLCGLTSFAAPAHGAPGTPAGAAPCGPAVGSLGPCAARERAGAAADHTRELAARERAGAAADHTRELAPDARSEDRIPPAREAVRLGFTPFLGLGRGTTNGRDAPSGPLLGVALQLRLLRIGGLDLAVQHTGLAGQRALEALLPRYRLSAALVLIPTASFDLVLQLGLGARNPGDLLDPSGATTSYHLGPSLELRLSRHVLLTWGLIWHLAGVQAVQDRLAQEGEPPRLRSLINLDNRDMLWGLSLLL